MTVDCDDLFWQERLEKLKAQIVAFEDALLFFAENGNAQSYTLDTGQTRTTVQRAEISSLQNTLEALLSRYDDLCARLCGATINLRPMR